MVYAVKDGDIVIAEVDGGWTMKYFRKVKSQVYLEPANKKYKNISGSNPYPKNYKYDNQATYIYPERIFQGFLF
jgi:hypothetical protein